jgi:TPR repeat protein
VDESFEAAWERAKLTAPPESPHLSRAAAGSIIGIALAVILGALAFNFRQDIGSMVIAAGEKISGGNHAVAPAASVPASANQAESPTGAIPSSSDKPDTPASQAAPAQTTGSTNGPTETRTADSAAQHDVSSATAHDANSVAPRHTASSGTTSSPASNGSANPSSGGVTTGAGSSSLPVGTTPAMIGTEPGSGEQEFNAAREMLKGDHRHRDLSKAVDLLWAGVRKGYVPAEVTLADLYRRGDGVQKNCDQAQVLLVAASKKGSPEARQLLELMAEQGCRD